MSPSSTESSTGTAFGQIGAASEPTGERASSDELAVVAEAVLEDHEKLDATVARLRKLCAALAHDQAAADPAAAALIEEFEAQLIPHFLAEQAEEYFGSLVTDQPRLLEQVQHLQAEHAEMAETLGKLLEFTQTGPPGPDLARRLTRFLDQFDAHEHAENTLMQEFLLLDDVARHGRPMKVGEIMKSDVSACSPGDTLEKVAGLMAGCGCDLVVVLDESRHLLGMITDRDLWMSAYREKAPLAAIVASTAMSQGLAMCSPTEEVSAVERRMQRSAGARCTAVVNERGEFVGLITLARIAALRELSR